MLGGVEDREGKKTKPKLGSGAECLDGAVADAFRADGCWSSSIASTVIGRAPGWHPWLIPLPRISSNL